MAWTTREELRHQRRVRMAKLPAQSLEALTASQQTIVLPVKGGGTITLLPASAYEATDHWQALAWLVDHGYVVTIRPGSDRTRRLYTVSARKEG